MREVVFGRDGLERPKLFRIIDEIGIAPRIQTLSDLFLGWVIAEVFIETDIMRTHAFGLANVPLARQKRVVARAAQQLRQAYFIRPRILFQFVSGKNGPCQPSAVRQPTCQNRRTRRRACLLRIAGCQPQTLACQSIHVRRRSSNRCPASIASRITIAHVVDHKPDNVWPLASL